MENDKIVNEVENLLSEHGLTISQFIGILEKHNSSCLNLSQSNYKKFSDIYEKIRDGRYDRKNKGRLLENLTEILFHTGSEGVFECWRNCRTSTNEIDLMLAWSEGARRAGLNSAYSCFGDTFLCECKNYKGKIDVTYVGKFCSLLMVTRTKLGIMITWDGVTGRSAWSDSKGLIKKIALKEDIYILTIDKNDLKQIYERKTNIFSIVYDKYLALKNEINYEDYIKTHAAATVLSE